MSIAFPSTEHNLPKEPFIDSPEETGVLRNIQLQETIIV